MLTTEQQKWLSTLSDNDCVNIFAYDQNVPNIFQKTKTLIQSKIGYNYEIVHHGASSFKISGQNEIDIYILSNARDFHNLVEKVSLSFGKPESLGLQKRARYSLRIENKKIDLFVVNTEHSEWQLHMKFRNYLLKDKELLNQYKKIKESMSGKSTRDYYTAKLKFINLINSK